MVTSLALTCPDYALTGSIWLHIDRHASMCLQAIPVVCSYLGGLMVKEITCWGGIPFMQLWPPFVLPNTHHGSGSVCVAMRATLEPEAPFPSTKQTDIFQVTLASELSKLRIVVPVSSQESNEMGCGRRDDTTKTEVLSNVWSNITGDDTCGSEGTIEQNIADTKGVTSTMRVLPILEVEDEDDEDETGVQVALGPLLLRESASAEHSHHVAFARA